MKKLYSVLVIGVLVFFSAQTNKVFAQCGVVAKVSSLNVVCGDSISLTAIPSGLKPLNNDFNGNTLGPFGGTNGVTITDGTGTYSCMGPSPDPNYYAFMGSTSNTPRFIQSNPLDLKQGGAIGATICFYMKYSTQGQSGTCEGPDATTEGVYLEYSTNCSTWTQIQYWDPKGGNDPQLTAWNQYCLNVPAVALTPATCFRWIQKSSSGVGYDTWAIDQVQVILNVPGYKYDWMHDAQGPSANPNTPNVAPSTNTTYMVTYSNKASGGTDTCTASVSVIVTKPQVTTVPANPICPGGTAQLQAISPYQAVAPTSCGIVPNNCSSISEQSVDVQVGAGVVTNTGGNCNGNIFGTSNAGGAVRSQILFRASELIAAGLKAGKINSIQFQISSITGANTVNNFAVRLGCTGITQLQSFGGDFETNVSSLVVNSRSLTLAVGWNQINFDNYYAWDGTTNLIVDLCWNLGFSTTAEAQCYTFDNSTTYPAVSTYCTNGAGGASNYCGQPGNSGFNSYSRRPNVIFGLCSPRIVTMFYNWTPSAGLSSTTSRTPTASPGSTTTYTVSAYAIPYSQCATTANVTVQVANTSVSIAPVNPVVCPPGTPSVGLTATATNDVPFSGPVTFTSGAVNLAFPDNTPAGVTSSISVTGINPTTLGANPVVSVCTNVTATGVQDTKLILTSPAGTSITLYNSNGTGANFTNTCFVSGSPAITTGTAPYSGNYAPGAAFQSAGNVNGTWLLNAADVKKPIVGNVNGGTLKNWQITFNTNQNNGINYQWINNITGLSTTTMPNPTASPSVTSTYTVKVTDAMGCTGTQVVIIGYCATVPVKMVKELSAEREGASVRLTWTTAQEINNAFFHIERSFDGVIFEDLGTVAGKGNTSVSSDYVFRDEHPGAGTNYYRLKQVDFNGDANFTDLVSVVFSSATQGLLLESLQPVPTRDILSYKLISPFSGNLQVQVLDISGKILSTDTQKAQIGQNSFTADVSGLPKGIYMLKVSLSSGDYSIKRFTK